MALYLGSNRVEANHDGVHYVVNSHLITGKIKSSDGYYMTDEDGVYVTLQEDESAVAYAIDEQ